MNYFDDYVFFLKLFLEIEDFDSSDMNNFLMGNVVVYGKFKIDIEVLLEGDVEIVLVCSWGSFYFCSVFGGCRG